MEQELFEALLLSMEEMGQISRGECEAFRMFEVSAPEPVVAAGSVGA